MHVRRFLRAVAGLCAAVALAAQAQILIGQTAGFSGAAAAGVKETTDGAKLYIDAVNARGGVHGQKIKLLSLDDRFDPQVAAENARSLIEEQGVLAMFLTRGTPHTQAVLPVLEKNGVALVGPSTGAMGLHQPVHPYVFNVRATYQREAERAIAHLAGIGITRVALVFVDDSFGNDGVQGALKGLRGANLEAVLQEKIDRNTPDFSAIVPRVVAAQAQAVMVIASGVAVAQGVKALRVAGSKAQVVTLSNNASGGFIKNLGDLATGVIVSQVFPQSLNFAMVKEASDLARTKHQAEPSPAMLEGFAAAKVLVEALRRAGPKPSRERLWAVLDGLGRYDLGGLEVGYSSQDHSGLDFADLSIISSTGKFRR